MLEFRWWRSNKITCHIHRYHKKIIWGNKHITFENKPIVFDNWIKSDWIYVNDILDATKTLSSKCILEKLKFKSNWIAEFNILKKSIPKNWINIKTENSTKSIVNIKRDKIIWKNNYIETSYLSNKMLYNSLLFNKIESSIGVDKWVKVLDIQEKPFMKPLYKFIFSYLEENKLKIFRWKLIQYIIPTNNYYFNGKLWIIIDVTFVEMKKTIFITLLHVLFWKRFGKNFIIFLDVII